MPLRLLGLEQTSCFMYLFKVTHRYILLAALDIDFINELILAEICFPFISMPPSVIYLLRLRMVLQLYSPSGTMIMSQPMEVRDTWEIQLCTSFINQLPSSINERRDSTDWQEKKRLWMHVVQLDPLHLEPPLVRILLICSCNWSSPSYTMPLT